MTNILLPIELKITDLFLPDLRPDKLLGIVMLLLRFRARGLSFLLRAAFKILPNPPLYTEGAKQQILHSLYSPLFKEGFGEIFPHFPKSPQSPFRKGGSKNKSSGFGVRKPTELPILYF